jgi:hypothetical protein
LVDVAVAECDAGEDRVVELSLGGVAGPPVGGVAVGRELDRSVSMWCQSLRPPREVARSEGEATDLAYLRLAYRLHDAHASFFNRHPRRCLGDFAKALGPVSVEMLLGVRPRHVRAPG